jgi:hypothetical protein
MSNRQVFCLECGKAFGAQGAQIFCSVECGVAWRQRAPIAVASTRSRRQTQRRRDAPRQVHALRPVLTIRLETDYTASAVPYLQSFGAAHHSELDTALSKLPAEWSFEDRLFVTLAPAQRRVVTRYYRAGGKRLVDIYSPATLARLDVALVRRCRELLHALWHERNDGCDAPPNPALAAGGRETKGRDSSVWRRAWARS